MRPESPPPSSPAPGRVRRLPGPPTRLCAPRSRGTRTRRRWSSGLFPSTRAAPGFCTGLRRSSSSRLRAREPSSPRPAGSTSSGSLLIPTAIAVEVSHASEVWRPEDVLARLRASNPDAYVFRLDLDGGMGGLFDEPGTLLGASPELVLSCTDSRIWTLPLAGTIARGTDPASDTRAARALLSSGKDLAEHAHVSRAVVEALGRHACRVAPGHPDRGRPARGALAFGTAVRPASHARRVRLAQ